MTAPVVNLKTTVIPLSVFRAALLGDVMANFGIPQHIICPGSAAVGFERGMFPGLYQVKAHQAHILHRACSSTDIARVRGIDQHDSYIFKHVCILLCFASNLHRSLKNCHASHG